ncbi:tetratricopeptide repeat protein, partial [Gemmiger formicilis]|uniref:tetratricopeptide repeat protein n=2 Tax=Bacteria TaxID=2 RepID=UPI0022E4240D
MNDIKCPKCGSEDVFQKQDGSCLCGACGHRFVPQTAEKTFVPMRLFISYGHKESEICKRIYQALKDRGHQPWFDEEQIRFGHDWRERLANGIEASNSVVACLSQYSTREKGVCLDELAISVGVKGGNIVSILLDDVNPPSAVSHRQWLDMRDWEEKLDAGEDVFKPWFDAKMAELYAVLESEENREFSGQITELQNRLTIYYSTSRQAKLLRNSFVGRAWLNDAITNWLQDDTAPRTCLLTGAPGVGKSAYAAHFTHYNDHVAAALFCSSEMNTFNDPRTVIQTVAYLMACRLTAYRQSLMLHLPEDRAAVQRLSEKELFEQLISKPLSLSVNGNHERMVILLDGLDECGSPENNVLAKTLYEFADSLPDWLRILIVARDIPAISVYTKGAYRIEIGSESESNLEDIRTYYRFELESKFGDDPQLADALERMTIRSQGIFLYAQMLTDLLRSRGTLGATEEYPDGLDAVFTRWFSWFFSGSDFRSFWRPAISCILGAPAPLPAETLRRVMHWGENELADFRARLKVLLRVEKNEFDEETLVFDHAFVREWLTRGAGENVYFCSPKDGAEKLTAELFSIFERGPEELSFWEAVHLMDLPLGESQREKAVESLALDVRVRYAGDYCETWGKYDKAEEIYEKALTFAEERDRKLTNEDSQRIIAYYLKRKSDMMFTRGKIAQSVELEEKAFSIVQDIAEKNPTDKNRRNLSISYNRIGDMLEEQGKLDCALDMFRKSLSIDEKLSLELGTPQSQRDLSVSYGRVGKILQVQGDFTGALDMFRKSLSIAEKLSLELGTPQSQRDLSVSYNKVGGILREQGDFTSALDMFRKSLSIRENLSLELGTPQSQRDLSVSYDKVGDILREQGDFTSALDMFRKSLSIAEKLSLELGTPQSQRDLSVSYEKVGDILREQGDFIGA